MMSERSSAAWTCVAATTAQLTLQTRINFRKLCLAHQYLLRDDVLFLLTNDGASALTEPS